MNGRLEDLLTGMRSLWRRYRTIRELSTLSDRMLTDIGLDRSEIRSVAEDLYADRDGSRVRTSQRTRPLVVSIEAAKSSTDDIAWRRAA